MLCLDTDLGVLGSGSGGSLAALIPYTGTGSAQGISFGFTPDVIFFINGNGTNRGSLCYDSSRGITKYLNFDEGGASSTGNEFTLSDVITSISGSTVNIGTNADINTNTKTYYALALKKSANFFDIITYAGNSTGNRAVAHALGATPSVVAAMPRTYQTINPGFPVWNGSSIRDNWPSWRNTNSFQGWPAGGSNVDVFGSSNHDASNIYVQDRQQTNTTGVNYVGYLFAETSGNFYQNSYSGSDSLDVTISHPDFQSPAFYLIKCFSTNGDWIIVSPTIGNDKYLFFAAVGSVQTVAANTFTFNAGSLVIKGSPSQTNFTSSGRIFRVWGFR